MSTGRDLPRNEELDWDSADIIVIGPYTIAEWNAMIEADPFMRAMRDLSKTTVWYGNDGTEPEAKP